MSIPVDLPDKPGQGELWTKTRALTNDYLRQVALGDKHEVKRLERRLDETRKQFHHLHGKKVPPSVEP